MYDIAMVLLGVVFFILLVTALFVVPAVIIKYIVAPIVDWMDEEK